MSCVFRNLKQSILKCDLFCTTQFLRYDKEPEYRTFTGGVCSILIVIILVATFSNVALETFSKSNINWSMDNVEETVEPFSFKATTEGINKWMFAFGINGLNLNGPEREFDVQMVQRIQISGKQPVAISFKLVPCTLQRWAINPEIISISKRFHFQRFLCPAQNQNFELEGKFTAENFKYVDLRIRKCNQTLDPSRPCSNGTAQAEYLAKMGGYFYINFYFLNSLINPSSSDFISYYLEDRNYLQFTTKVGGIINLFLSKYSIETDESITPVIDKHVEKGVFATALGQIISFQITEGQEYARIVLRRSSTEVICKRSYTKIDETLSYIGGLFGCIMTCMLLMKFYTQMSFEIQVGDHLYEYQKGKSIQSKQFNLLLYFGYIFYLALKQMGCKLRWELMQKYDDCRQQIQSQFDVRLLFERIIFLQRIVTIILDNHQYNALYLCKKLTLKQAQFMRTRFQLKDEITNQPEVNNTEQNIMSSSNKITPIKSNQIAPVDKPQCQFDATNEKTNQMKMKAKKDLKLLRKESLLGNQVSRKIFQELQPNIVEDSELSSQKDPKQSEMDHSHFNLQVNPMEHNLKDPQSSKEREKEEGFIFLN